MRVEIIRIGNSKGLRIPKAVLEQCGIKTAVRSHAGLQSIWANVVESFEADRVLALIDLARSRESRWKR